jgi:SAM-dependent methyltransferase
MAGKIMEPYSIYGHFYDATQGAPNGEQYIHLLRKHHPHARTLLEIACGTGAHLAPLVQHYDVTGLDISRTMLAYARMRLPQIVFHHQSMVGFKLDRTFDAIICPFDSINHLLGFGEWAQTFKAARQHLKPGGVFIFDINTEYRLQDLATLPAWAKRFGDNYVVMKVSKSERDAVDWDIKVFEKIQTKKYRLHHEVIKERSFAHERVKKTLEGMFRRVRAYDVAGWGRVKAASRRVYYVCKA